MNKFTALRSINIHFFGQAFGMSNTLSFGKLKCSAIKENVCENKRSSFSAKRNNFTFFLIGNNLYINRSAEPKGSEG